jgi:hypothetical protein
MYSIFSFEISMHNCDYDCTEFNITVSIGMLKYLHHTNLNICSSETRFTSLHVITDLRSEIERVLRRSVA